MDEVLRKALALPESERAQLVDALIATFSPEDGAPLDDAWLAEINRRSDEFDAGGVEPIPWAEAARMDSSGSFTDSCVHPPSPPVPVTTCELLVPGCFGRNNPG